MKFKDRKSKEICREIVGKELVRHEGGGGATAGVIVEVESYVGDVDAASHLSGGVTSRNTPFFGGPGNIYVFKSTGTTI